MDIVVWLRSLGLGKYEAAFRENEIDERIRPRPRQSAWVRYLRMLFIQGARAIQLHPASWAKHSFGPWLAAAARRLHCNVLTVALANKLARIALTVLLKGPGVGKKHSFALTRMHGRHIKPRGFGAMAFHTSSASIGPKPYGSRRI
jgi:hypothetical protein